MFALTAVAMAKLQMRAASGGDSPSGRKGLEQTRQRQLRVRGAAECNTQGEAAGIPAGG